MKEIVEYLEYAINDLEKNLIDSIKETKQSDLIHEKHRHNVLVFKELFPNNDYIPLYYIEECELFNKLHEENINLHKRNFSLISKIVTLKSNLTWFKNDGEEDNE